MFFKVISESKLCFSTAFTFEVISFSTSKTSNTLWAAAKPFLTEYEAFEIAFAGVRIL